ncbi:MAG: hypothetical protein U5L96_17715 [Owenweeksia sp.]|nr:hypothetical protein [Owenweeksia sp.]
MPKLIFLALGSMYLTVAQGQYYFPPANSPGWDTTSPAALGWCTSEVDTLYDYLESRNTKSFIVLHRGKMVP